ncbi:hypothetical protein VHEMI09723 [[Torrubiella] hemipterigena]|uniref:RING-CH-type domain-containing protein n=1 Tax=[Torrubiella] hemipterigena TaxID=1531966 RepID=A0A0A1TQM9_9HYPO|nr:hypothetical protein VHEMI09723 [[Torrubiella] hemipterigena]
MDTQSQWNWSAVDDEGLRQRRQQDDSPSAHEEDDSAPEVPEPPRPEPTRRRGFYPPRTCRICLDTETAKFRSTTRTSLGLSASSTKPIYESDDPELGRLLSPCKCKGTQKYVHEGCLNAWRKGSPDASANLWQCPTCLYQYKLVRLQWASLLGSKLIRALLTIVIFVISVFLLGFVADPIFNLWMDPFGTIGDSVAGVLGDDDNDLLYDPIYESTGSWLEHWLKGFFSLGVVGVIKSTLMMSPWHWAMRVGGRRRRGNGRDRVEDISLVLVLIGAFAALKGIWSGVRMLSDRILQSVRDKVLDVNDDGDEPEPEPEPKAEADDTANAAGQS